MSSPVVSCTVRDGKFVEPCETLGTSIDNNVGSFSKARGVTHWHFTNLNTRQPSRSFIGLRSKRYPKGMLFNFCPYCGTDISSPFQEKDEEDQQHDN